MDQRFDRFCENLLTELWRENPVEATFFGIHDYDDLLGSFSKDSVTDFLDRRKRYLHELNTVHRLSKDLSPDQHDDLELLDDRFRVEEHWFGVWETHHRDPNHYLDIIMDGLFVLIIRDTLPLDRRIEHIRNRLGEVPRFIVEAMENLRRKPKEIPPLWIEMAIEHASAGLHFISDAIPAFVRQSAGHRNDVEESARRAAESIESFKSFLQDEITPLASGRYELGEAEFDFLLRRRHRLSQSPSDLLSTAERVADEVDWEMREITRAMRGTDDWTVVVEELKKSHPPEVELLSTYTSEVVELKRFLEEHDLVTLPGDEDLIIIETPLFMRHLIPYGAYIPPGPFEEEDRGHFMVTLPTKEDSGERRGEILMGHNSFALPITSLHEGYPGHHLQLVTSNRVSRGIRKISQSDLFAEGWALYCEQLMSETGYYTDPGTKLMQLKDLLWRSCRVMIDIGLHAGELEFTGAVDILVDRAGLEKSNAVSEVKRYTRSPTQPLTYLIGKMEILRLRELIRGLEGENFNLRTFHDRLLSYGTVPMDIIARRITKTVG